MKNFLSVLIPAAALLAMLACECAADTSKQAADPVPPVFFYGQTLAEVQQLLGEPDGTMTASEKIVLLYSGEALEFISGKWINPQADIRARIADGKKAVVKRAAIQKAEVKKEKPRAVTPPPGKKAEQASAPTQSASSEYSGLTVPGKITVVDFYADWCGPCKQMAPVLDKLTGGKADIALKKVDIVNWDSAVAKKYGITSIPNVRVFDKQGRMVGSPTSSPDQIAQYIKQAKQSK
ncbi:MAG: thioredoxin family protein [Kiritimatiellales bacterium]|jgi:thiol-disulfide isomerase/thioredoxin